MPDETDAFGRPIRPESTDPFGAPVDPQTQAPAGWAPPTPPPDRPEATTAWQPPVSPGAPAVEPSGWWRRVGAAVLDGLVLGIGGGVLGAIVVAATDATDDETTGIGLVLGLIVGALYYGLLMSRAGASNGQTLGKQATGIRVVRDDGQPFTFGFALVRELAVKTLLFGYAAIITLYLATLLNYLWPLWDPENRALHDRICKTRVMRV